MRRPSDPDDFAPIGQLRPPVPGKWNQQELGPPGNLDRAQWARPTAAIGRASAACMAARGHLEPVTPLDWWPVLDPERLGRQGSAAKSRTASPASSLKPKDSCSPNELRARRND